MTTNTISKPDFSGLRSRILMQYDSIEAFASAIGMDPVDLASKLDSRKEFVLDEIQRIRSALCLDDSDTQHIFFPDPDVNYPRFGLKVIRHFKGISKESAAAAAGVSVEMLTKWEHGKAVPSHEHAAKLSDLYDVSLDMIDFCYKPSIVKFGKSGVTTYEILTMARILRDLPQRDRQKVLDALADPHFISE